ncbi:type 4 pilus major pilin [Burkholderia multivorans]|uniref:type 4 pilus major pilin n=1 Tax=Burkholderia multivorans TaxID=87883 RepID=UPI00075C5D8F|nr:type 4 pilus major pilin [Burkholderia multivorans]KVS13913.1 prepilin type IV pili [Burkholderia multivorans]MBU9651050.1 prepilin type IV pili [Burkholderia multivorans]MCO1451056.1 prepilin type IV pili [Burkholderia multivorans]MDN8103904.1 type 4 pilus major pilin [Burkholderia multivorans]PRG70428.1 prepilin type IV pili [Burkholderia multivorans]
MEGILARLAVIALTVLAFAAVGVNVMSAFSRNKSAQMVMDTAHLITNARAGFAQSGNGYANFTTANGQDLINAGIIPSNMVRNGSTVVDVWGNSMSFASANNGAQGVVTFGGGGSETKAQCGDVVAGMKDYVSLAVGGTTFTASNPPDQVTASKACTDTASIVVTFQ